MVHDDRHSLATWLFRLLAFAVVCCAAATSAAQAADTVRIGSKNFTEQEILAELVAQLIERHTDLR
ncbi:MAG: glycine/betaine ABC transporter substrate-binding protein, partial [Phycisphaerae bacterium]|nr:glycine/betaine ABC transporter substrate-binding protein [Phycisphaerae bacterium]